MAEAPGIAEADAMTLPLTEKQERLWRYIKSCERSPSYLEMATAMGLSSRSNLHTVVLALKKKGYVSYIPGLARTIIALDPDIDLTRFSTAELAAEIARRLAA
jgi:SOS-response transcriptional repressor LexA